MPMLVGVWGEPGFSSPSPSLSLACNWGHMTQWDRSMQKVEALVSFFETKLLSAPCANQNSFLRPCGLIVRWGGGLTLDVITGVLPPAA